MLHANVSGIKDPMKQDQALEFWKKQNKDINILTETYANHDQFHQIRNDWLGPIFSNLEISWTYFFLTW